MSPLVQHKRAAAVSVPPRRPKSAGQHWAMLLFESASAGVMAIFVGFLALLLVVGVYVIVIWPLTFWDLADLHLERYSAWIKPALWSVFGGGTVGGFLCFSGLAFGRRKQKAVAPAPAGAPRLRQATTSTRGGSSSNPRAQVLTRR